MLVGFEFDIVSLYSSWIWVCLLLHMTHDIGQVLKCASLATLIQIVLYNHASKQMQSQAHPCTWVDGTAKYQMTTSRSRSQEAHPSGDVHTQMRCFNINNNVSTAQC